MNREILKAKIAEAISSQNTSGNQKLEMILAAVDTYSSADNGAKPIVSGSLPTLEDAWDAGVEEGSTRAGNFDWGIRYKNIEFSQWYAAELEYRSSGQ